MPTHPEYGEFIKIMQDPKLLDPIVVLGDLAPFVRGGTARTEVLASASTLTQSRESR
jgi:hypothetical protein